MKGYRKKDPFGIYTVTPVKWKKGRRNGSAVERTIGRRQSSVNHVTYLPCTHREERETSLKAAPAEDFENCDTTPRSIDKLVL